jgi:hypothetical protein
VKHVVLIALLAALACHHVPDKRARYCRALCEYLVECVVTSQPIIFEECKRDCKKGVYDAPWFDVCKTETLDYYTCGYEISLEQDCAGDPYMSVIEGCEHLHEKLEECREQQE